MDLFKTGIDQSHTLFNPPLTSQQTKGQIMSEYDFSELDNGQLCAIFDGLGNSASDFKTAIVAELTERLLAEYPCGMSPWYCGVSDDEARRHAEWLPVYVIVKDSAAYQKHVDAVLRKTCPNGP